MRIYRAADARTMPWKNGGGTTTEILTLPEGAGLDAFDVRISRARIERDGPFSSFPGVDRVLTVVFGNGVRLDFQGRGSVTLSRDAEPLAFLGETVVSASLLDGAIEDLNVMTRRSRMRAAVVRARLDGATRFDPLGATSVVYVVSGALRVGEERVVAGDTLLTHASVDLIGESADVLMIDLLPV